MVTLRTRTHFEERMPLHTQHTVFYSSKHHYNGYFRSSFSPKYANSGKKNLVTSLDRDSQCSYKRPIHVFAFKNIPVKHAFKITVYNASVCCYK
jgi:hypothetical protein